MRWLLLKDLRILRRSPLLLALLVLYPAVLAVLVGLALSGAPAKPRVAVVNEVRPGDETFSLGGAQVDTRDYAAELLRAIDAVMLDTRAEAVEAVRRGEVLGALVIPQDITQRLQSAATLAGTEPPTLEVLYNAEDPVKRRYVESVVKARVADANQALSRRLTEVAAGYLDLLLEGGAVSVLGRDIDVLGLERSRALLGDVAAGLPAGSPERRALEQVAAFAGTAIDNLDLSDDVLATVGQPLRIETTVVAGRASPLDAYAAVVAVVVALMLVALLLAAGLLVLEREEGVYARLVRGLVRRTSLVAAKAVLGGALGGLAALALLLALALVIGLDLGRAPAWLPALAAAALAFAGLGVALGALAREVRTASLLALLVALPVACLGLVPSGAVGPGAYEAVRAVSAAFPFAPAITALDAGVNAGAVVPAVAHLAGLAAAYLLLARLGLRRWG